MSSRGVDVAVLAGVTSWSAIVFAADPAGAPSSAASGAPAAAGQQSSVNDQARSAALEWLRAELDAALTAREQAKRSLEGLEKKRAAPATGVASPAPAPTEPAAGQAAEAAEQKKEPEAPARAAQPPADAPAEDAAAGAPADPNAEIRALRVQASVLEERVEALETAIHVLRGNPVAPAALEQARTVLREWRRTLAREVAAEDAPAAGAAAPDTRARVAVRQLDVALEAFAAAEQSISSADTRTEATKKQLEFKKGDRLQYGPTVSLLRFSTARAGDEPGRNRNYQPRLELVPAEFGFQFVYEPQSAPWRLPRSAGEPFQLMSVGGMLLAQVDKDRVERGSLGIAATLSFFEQVLGVGVGVDLYRGIPIQGADGSRGGQTAYTGLLSWSLAREGELTPENVFFVVTLGLEPIISGLTDEVKP